MTERSATGLPKWVAKKNGRLEPFDADKISEALFAATEAMGYPNAFLARELTDAVVHFLLADPSDAPYPTTHIEEQIIKVVRELGLPALAQAFAQASLQRTGISDLPPVAARSTATFTFSTEEAPIDVQQRCLRAYSERAVFARDLNAAQRDGLLLLTGLQTPRAIACCVLETTHGSGAVLDFWSDLPAVRDVAGQGLVLDGPEWHSAGAGETVPREAYRGWLVQLPALARRHVVVNVNTAQPPAWARHRNAGPLFTDDTPAGEPAGLPLLETILDVVPRPTDQPLRWDWHLQARDFAAGAFRDRLRRLARHALEGRPVAFVFDRSRRSVVLAEGIDRQRPAVLMEVGIDLNAFLRLPEIAQSSDRFRDKLPSLARMAVSAGAQKRKYLRRHAEGTPLARGFLLDRARLAVVPIGLDAVVRALTGQGPAASPFSLELARQLVRSLNDHIQAAGRSVHLDVGLDSPGPGLADMMTATTRNVAGLSCADALASPERQLEAASALHAIAGQGTARVILTPTQMPGPDEVLDLLQFAWRRTEVVRVIFVRDVDSVKQPELGDP